MLAVLAAPGRYVQGKNATTALGHEMQQRGLEGPALIVAGQSAIRLLADVWQQCLRAAGIAPSVHAFGGECSWLKIERIQHSAQAHKSHVIIGAGGGEVLDAARAAADAIGRAWQQRSSTS